MSDTRHGTPDLSGAIWRSSSYSGGQGDCVEVATNLPALTPIRDSKTPTGPHLTFTPRAWRTFITHLS
ncbi:DUF397 domain-containing protein [Streptomyces sp. NPDC004539]|uniref:DUF397 domain-containing protein n=1 Tax=Streptomyces sp. NPDC004539 TaxID=3154280 RepID=UPI0033BBFDA1